MLHLYDMFFRRIFSLSKAVKASLLGAQKNAALNMLFRAAFMDGTKAEGDVSGFRSLILVKQLAPGTDNHPYNDGLQQSLQKGKP